MKETVCKRDICNKTIKDFECDSMILRIGNDPEKFKLNISGVLEKDICEKCCRYFTRTDKVKNMKLEDAFCYQSYSKEVKEWTKTL